MSILLFKPANVNLESTFLFDEEILNKSPLSVSYSYAENGELVTIKTPNYDNGVWDELSSLRQEPLIVYINEDDKRLLNKDMVNWSPVQIDNNIVIAGAGPILKINGERENTQSDVRVFRDQGLRGISHRIPNFLFSFPGVWMIERILTQKAAMVALRSDGSYSIFNKEYGTVINDIWVFDALIAQTRYSNFIYQEMLWRQQYQD